MEFSTKIAIVQAVKAYMEQHNLTQSDVSKKSGVSKAYLSLILKEDSNFMYEAGANKQGLIPAKNFYALAALAGYSIEKVYWETQPTPQMIQILSNLKEAKEFGSTGVITGETGGGKTYVINLFASRNPHDTFIITVGSSDNLGDIIDKIVEALKIPSAKSKSAKLRSIAKKMRELKAQGYKPQLIFDECEYMKQPALCSIKELYDSLISICSIMLVGTDQLTLNIDKLRKRNKAGIPQFYRRIKFGIRILPTIDRKYDIFIQDLEDKQLKTFLQRNCDNYGELHDVLVPALREADRTNEPLSLPLVKKVLDLPDMLYV